MLLVGGAWMATSALRRVVVVGESMTPAFCDGDRLLVLRTPRWVRLRPGDVVASADPRAPSRLLVKRVAECARSAGVVLVGDNRERSTDSRTFGAVERGTVWGLVVYRYSPSPRAGAVSRGARA